MPRLVRSLLHAAPLLLAGEAHAQSTGKAPPPAAVGVMEVHRAPVIETSEYVGRIQAVDSVALVPRITGFLEQRLFIEGSEVTKGQLLYVIEQPPYQAQVEANQGTLQQAQAQAQFANVQFQRQQNLLNTPAGQRSTYDQALATARSDAAQVLSAEANLKTAQINLGYTEIRAPIDGRITETSVNPGNVVSPTSGTLATIVSQDPMYVEFPIAERDLLQLRNRYGTQGGLAALQIRLRLNTGSIYDQPGKLDYVSPTVSTTTDTITLRATVPNPKRGQPAGGSANGAANGGTGDRQLINGEFVTVLLQAPQPISLVTIPQSAVLSDQQGSYVFALGSDNVAHRRNVHLGQQTGTEVAVLSGLDDGTRIVTEGLQRVHEGGKVVPGAPQAPTVPQSGQGATAGPHAQEQTRGATMPGSNGNGGGASGR